MITPSRKLARFWWPALFVACQPASPGAAPVPRTIVTTSSPVASATSSPVAATTAGSAPSAPLAASASATPPLPSATPEAIACGDGRCKLGSEVCCLKPPSGAAKCFAPPADKPPYWPGCGREVARCDEAADCGAGEICCLDRDDTSWGGYVASCRKPPCPGAVDLCLPGGRCRAGYDCQPSEGVPYARCVWKPPPTRCGQQTCGDKAPLCCFDTKTGRAECIAGKSCSTWDDAKERFEPPNKVAFGCTTSTACGDELCADEAGLDCVPFGAPPQEQSFRCRPRDRAASCATRILCTTKLDCPPTFERRGEKARRLAGCVHAKDLPPGAKVCRYAASKP